jgi:hypothetical protein
LAGLNVVIQSLSSQELLAAQFNLLGSAYQPRGVTPAMFEVYIVLSTYFFIRIVSLIIYHL